MLTGGFEAIKFIPVELGPVIGLEVLLGKDVPGNCAVEKPPPRLPRPDNPDDAIP